MPSKAETLQDRFTAASLDSTLWQGTAYLGGTASFGTAISYSYGLVSFPTGATSGICSKSAYDLTDSAVTVELVFNGPGDNFFLVENVDSGNAAWWQCGEVVECVYTDSSAIASATYDASLHRFLRIREESGSIHWDISADGLSWNTFAYISDPFDATNIQVSLYSLGDASGDTYTAQFGNVGYIPVSQRQALEAATAADLINLVATNDGEFGA